MLRSYGWVLCAFEGDKRSRLKVRTTLRLGRIHGCALVNSRLQHAHGPVFGIRNYCVGSLSDNLSIKRCYLLVTTKAVTRSPQVSVMSITLMLWDLSSAN